MNLFGNKPQERAMSSLIHDTNSATTSLDWRIRQVSEWLTENTKAIENAGINTSNIHVIAQYLKSGTSQLQKAIDLYYERFSKDFSDDTPPELQAREPNVITIKALQKEIAWLRNQVKQKASNMTRLSDHYRRKSIDLKKENEMLQAELERLKGSQPPVALKSAEEKDNVTSDSANEGAHFIKNGPFFIDTTRSLINRYIKEEISLCTLSDLLNETAQRWHHLNIENSKQV